MILDFNNLSDVRVKELIPLFENWINNKSLQYSNTKLFTSFVTLYVNTPEELVIVTALFAENHLFELSEN